MSATRPSFDSAQFRNVIGHFMSGVAVISTRVDDQKHGMTASAVCSLSLEPPMLLICLHQRSPTQEAILQTGAFGVSILTQQQGAVAQRFATPRPDKFDTVAHHLGPLGQPLLDEALAWIECEVAETHVGGSHRVILGAVAYADVRPGSPLAYYRGRFGRLELVADEHALERIRQLVLFRERPLDATLEPDDLAKELGLSEQSIHYALTRLGAEGLVRRTLDGYEQVALDAQASDEVFEAKLLIDRGAAELAVERADERGIERALQLAGAVPRDTGTRDRTDVARYVAANEAFHEHMIGLAGNAALLESYRRLRLPSLLSQILVKHDAASDALADEHVAIAEALARRDLPAMLDLIERHNEHGRNAHRRAILAAGGRV